jgi:hypothetical protein
MEEYHWWKIIGELVGEGDEAQAVCAIFPSPFEASNPSAN